MLHQRLRGKFIFLLILLGLSGGIFTTQAASPPEEPPGPDRFVLVTETYTRYTWWLTAWEDNEVECVLDIAHEGLPRGDEIYLQCGGDLYARWLQSQPCVEPETNTCAGYYLFLAETALSTRDVPKALPVPRLWIAAPLCLAQAVDLWCPETPSLSLLGDEPLDGYEITRIEGWLGDEPFVCRGAECALDFPAAQAEYHLRAWGYSSYGDSTPVMEADVRVSPSDTGWIITVLSPVRQGVPQPACGYLWHAFPSADGLPDWLRMPETADALQSKVRYGGLAGQLLGHGFAYASACPDGGLLTDGWASECGLTAVYEDVIAWQNQYDETIWDASRQYQISPWLLKNIFAVESQFWPGMLAENHAGLGQITEDGADLVLMWSPSFFEQFCPTVFRAEACAGGYNGLKDDDRALLRRALMAAVNAECPDCPGRLDRQKAQQSVYVFADVLRASCAQTGRAVENLTGKYPGEVFSYADLWRLTLANYHSGAGCLRDALNRALASPQDLSWETVSASFPPGCVDALPYVESVTR